MGDGESDDSSGDGATMLGMMVRVVMEGQRLRNARGGHKFSLEKWVEA